MVCRALNKVAAHRPTTAGVVLPLLQPRLITSFDFNGIDATCNAGFATPLFTGVVNGGSATITQSGTSASAPVTSGVQLAFGAQQESTLTLTVTNGAGSTSTSLSLFLGRPAGISNCGTAGGAPV